MSKGVLYLAPGLLCTGALWAHQIDGLSDFVDVRMPDMITDDNMAAMAARLLDEAPERFFIAGLSMGGYLAFEVIRQAPDRVEKLALLDTTWRADTAEAIDRRERLIAHSQSGHFGDVIPQLLPMLIHPNRRDDKPLVGTVKQMAADIGAEAFVTQQRAIMSRANSWAALAKIACPTLVLCGADDALTDLATHEVMAGEIPTATLEVIADCGHLSALERPESVTMALKTWIADD